MVCGIGFSLDFIVPLLEYSGNGKITHFTKRASQTPGNAGSITYIGPGVGWL